MSMSRVFPRIILGGERGGCGKTTLSAGLLAAWRNCGWCSRPFKKGPDYIDSAWLTAAAAHPCRNLDTFLMEEEAVARSFRGHAAETGVNLIEGNRGLFDGVDAGGRFSTAELAKLLECPVVLILDCEKRTRTTAAVALGARLLDPDVRIAGVILNRLGTARQERVTRAAIEQCAGLPVLGAVPRLPDLLFRERRLGLVPPQENGEPCQCQALEAAAKAAERYLDVEGLWKAAHEASPLPARVESLGEIPAAPPQGALREDLRIGYFFDSAFHFYYPDNLEALERAGADLIPIDAQRTPALPANLDGLYIGGGFPEERAPALSANRSMRESVRVAAENGLPIYAECGGLMYLARTLVTSDDCYPMAGVFPFSTALEPTPQGHGYVEAVVLDGHPFLAAGTRIRGHEFHYSRPVEWDEDAVSFTLSLTRGRGFSDGRDGIAYKNTFATYTHIHTLGEPHWGRSVVGLCAQYRRDRRSGAVIAARA
jgi:cobyrinic acid a,c-diamide synthase